MEEITTQTWVRVFRPNQPETRLALDPLLIGLVEAAPSKIDYLTGGSPLGVALTGRMVRLAYDDQVVFVGSPADMHCLARMLNRLNKFGLAPRYFLPQTDYSTGLALEAVFEQHTAGAILLTDEVFALYARTHQLAPAAALLSEVTR